MMLVFSMSVGAVYALNQLADKETDLKNSGFALLAQGGVKPRTAWVAAAVLALCAILGPIASAPLVACFSLAALATGCVYSFRPFSFSGRPVLDFLSNAFGYGVVAFGLGWHMAGRELLTHSFLAAAAPYFLLMCAGSISSTLPDYEGDLATGKNTTAVVAGRMRAHLLATALVLLAAGTAVYSRDPVALVCAVICLPIYAAYALHPSVHLMEATYKVGGAMLVFLAAFVYPVIAIPSAIVLFATVGYFRFRHGVSYPSLLPAHEHNHS